MITTRNGLSWLLLAMLVAMTTGCDHDGVMVPVEPKEGKGQPASVRLVPSKLVYTVEETVVALVIIESGTNVDSVSFDLQYNPNILQYVGIVEGDFMSSDGSDTDFLVVPTAGEIAVDLLRRGSGPGTSGTGVLARLEFFAAGAGDVGFAFTGGSVRDPRGENVPALFSTIPVRVVPSEAARSVHQLQTAAKAGVEG